MAVAGRFIQTSELEDAIAELMEEYGDDVYRLTEEGLDVAESILIKNLKAASPGSSPHKVNFAKNWKSKGKKYKMLRYVGNSTMVQGPDGEIPLANILEYSTNHGSPFIKNTFESSVDEMAAAVVNQIKKGV
ncbi:hypothetical protein [Acidaminobacter sp.]|uniref:hypothetical protein n=1 Tax=Acidaminobacter sp. TaxID=1872102 RepID=UPI00256A4214|nr:hypothetical protein [Acidaminobacter sp.]MDK9712313.1 hypothetical protein [Acidaminobacter sp.]